MIKLIIENRGWTEEQVNTFTKSVFPLAKKITKELLLVNNIIVILQDNSENQYGDGTDRALYDEGKIIIFNTSPDWSGDFVHELGHQLYNEEKISYTTKKKIGELRKELEEKKGDGRIFTNEHTWKTSGEVFCTLFKWYVFGKVVSEVYIEVLENFIPGAAELVEGIIKKEPLIKSTQNKKIIIYSGKKINKKVFVDMDGVLCDFDRQFLKYCGYTPVNYIKKFSYRKFMRALSTSSENFWSSMPWIKKGKELIKMLLSAKGIEVYILSTPVKNNNNSVTGKKKWIKKNIPSIPEERIILTENKYMYAEENSFLIDDMEKNLIPFEKNGGVSIFFDGRKTSINNVIDSIKNKKSFIEGDNDKIETNCVTTFSGYKTYKKERWNNLLLTIENPKGSIRKGVDEFGNVWENKMSFDYGYINGTHSAEMGGDHLDFFLGNDPNSKKVYVVKIQEPETKIYEEDKCFLNFSNKKDVVKAFQQNYDDKWKKRIKKIKSFGVNDFIKRVENKQIDL